MQNTIKTPRIFIEKKVAFLTKTIIVSVGLYFIVFATSAFAAPAERSLQLLGSNNDYVHISDAEQVGLDITGDMTIALWVKPSTLSGQQILVSKWNHVDKTSYMLFIEDGNVGASLNSEGSGYGYVSSYQPHGKSANEWFQLAMVYKAASGTVEFFVDGASVGKSAVNSMPTSMANTDADFVIGGRDNRTNFFSGNLDEVRIWSRALPASKIATLFSDPINTNSGPNLEGYWKFNGNLKDKSANNNDLGFTFSNDVPF